MREPYFYDKEPDKDFYLNRKKIVEIFSFYQKASFDGDVDYCNICDSEECSCEIKKIDDVSLQKIIDLVPNGVSLSDVKMEMEMDVGAMSVDGHSVTFYYLKKLKPNKSGYDKAKKEYDLRRAEYLEEKAKYDEWKLNDDIKKAEKKLLKLKSKSIK
jgi:hypothetical protein